MTCQLALFALLVTAQAFNFAWVYATEKAPIGTPKVNAALFAFQWVISAGSIGVAAAAQFSSSVEHPMEPYVFGGFVALFLSIVMAAAAHTCVGEKVKI